MGLYPGHRVGVKKLPPEIPGDEKPFPALLLLEAGNGPFQAGDIKTDNFLTADYRYRNAPKTPADKFFPRLMINGNVYFPVGNPFLT
jgi:hypothetical protein